MDKIELDDVFEVASSSEPTWIHCHPDKLGEAIKLMGGNVIVEYIESDDGEHYFCSVRKKT